MAHRYARRIVAPIYGPARPLPRDSRESWECGAAPITWSLALRDCANHSAGTGPPMRGPHIGATIMAGPQSRRLAPACGPRQRRPVPARLPACPSSSCGPPGPVVSSCGPFLPACPVEQLRRVRRRPRPAFEQLRRARAARLRRLARPGAARLKRSRQTLAFSTLYYCSVLGRTCGFTISYGQGLALSSSLAIRMVKLTRLWSSYSENRFGDQIFTPHTPLRGFLNQKAELFQRLSAI